MKIKKKEQSGIVDNDRKRVEARIKEIRLAVLKGDTQKAFNLSTALIEEVEKNKAFENDSSPECFYFDTPFEEIVYHFYYRPQKDVREATLPYGEVYFTHGNVLFELNRIAEAREYLKKALRWNPVSCFYAFEYIETFKATGEMDKFFELTKNQLKYAFLSEHVSRCYRNFGYYFIEKKDYSAAEICYYISLNYTKDNAYVRSQLDYIEKTAPEALPEFSDELIEQVKEKYDLPIGTNSDILEIAETCVRAAVEQKGDEKALYFLAIYYGIAKKEDADRLVAEIEEKVMKKK